MRKIIKLNAKSQLFQEFKCAFQKIEMRKILLCFINYESIILNKKKQQQIL